MEKIPSYIGRFAPSPTGELHFGSLITALASYLRARSCHGKWLLRIEDLDFLRNQKNAAQKIIQTLLAHGLEWDDTIIYQSERLEIYREYFYQMQKMQLIYPCSCSRKDLQHHPINKETGESVYLGTCQEKNHSYSEKISYRMKTENIEISFRDFFQGNIKQNINNDVGDFIIWRKENFPAYQLAVVIDDALQKVTEIVRGNDLLLQTPRQIYLQQKLNFNLINYAHVPLALNTFQQKLSKQNKAEPLNNNNAKENLKKALKFLGMNENIVNEISAYSENSNVFLQHALTAFNFKDIPHKQGVIF